MNKKNSVVHFEIYANAPEELARFYTNLFDWTVESMPGMDYRFIKTMECDEKGMPAASGGINGGMLIRPAGYEGHGWVNYVNVESVESAIERAQNLGATVMKGKSAVPGLGWFAMLVDPQGNCFAVWQGDSDAK